MIHLGYTSLADWCDAVSHDSLLLYLVGADQFPNASSHYDFINRLTNDHPHRSELLPEKLNSSSPASKLKRGEKWMNFINEDVASLADAYSVDSQWDRKRFSFTQPLFNAIAACSQS